MIRLSHSSYEWIMSLFPKSWSNHSFLWLDWITLSYDLIESISPITKLNHSLLWLNRVTISYDLIVSVSPMTGLSHSLLFLDWVTLWMCHKRVFSSVYWPALPHDPHMTHMTQGIRVASVFEFSVLCLIVCSVQIFSFLIVQYSTV